MCFDVIVRKDEKEERKKEKERWDSEKRRKERTKEMGRDRGSRGEGEEKWPLRKRAFSSVDDEVTNQWPILKGPMK